MVPHTKGKVTPSGVADLLVVKQALKGYQAADMAHVENVLKDESKNRTHKKATKTEAFVSSESETNNSEEHELSSTFRFEMSKEAANTLKEDQNLKAELKVSAKYGQAVGVDASGEGSASRSKEEVNKAASKFSQVFMNWTVKKITERLLQNKAPLPMHVRFTMFGQAHEKYQLLSYRAKSSKKAHKESTPLVVAEVFQVSISR